MPKSVQIVCDQCDRDLATTSNCEDFRLALVNERIPSQGGLVTMMLMHPAIKRDAYFCGVGCLAVWLAEHHPDALATYERQQKHRDWLKEREASLAPSQENSGI